MHKSKKNRQHNGQKKNDKRTNNDLQNIHIINLWMENVLSQLCRRFVYIIHLFYTISVTFGIQLYLELNNT
jgi:hypothetical protein